MVRIPHILKNTTIYAFFGGLSALVPFLLLPVLTRYLTPEDYGRWAVFNILVMFIAPLIRLEMQDALKREYVEKKSDFGQYLGTATTLSCVILAVFLLLWGGLHFVTDQLFGMGLMWVLAVLLIAWGKAHWLNLMSLFQIQDKAMLASVWGFLMVLATFLATLYLVVVAGFSWEGRAWPELVMYFVIQAPLCLYLLSRLFKMKWGIDKAKLREMLAFSLPLVPVSVGGYLIMTADRIFLTEIEGLDSVGLYSVAVQITSAMLLLAGSFRPTWESWVFRNLQAPTPEGLRKTVLALYGFTLFLLMTAFGIIVVVPFVLPWLVGADFHGAETFIVWLAFSGFALGLNVILNPFMYFIKKTNILNYITLTVAALNCALNYVLIHKFGAIGAAQATFISYAIGSAAVLFFVVKYHKLPWLLKGNVTNG
jgi:O-antigen/teichoic acid export membrane protein